MVGVKGVGLLLKTVEDWGVGNRAKARPWREGQRERRQIEGGEGETRGGVKQGLETTRTKLVLRKGIDVMPHTRVTRVGLKFVMGGLGCEENYFCKVVR